MKVALFALMTAILLQGGVSSPKELLSLQRPLTTAEMETVVSGVRQALAGLTLRLVHDHDAAHQVLMGQVGMPHMIRYSGSGERIATGVPARHCSGAPATGDMVLEYRLGSTTQTWTASARESHPGDMALTFPFMMLKMAASLESGATRLVGKHPARALVSRVPLSDADHPRVTGDPAPDPAEVLPVQSLWIDTDSLLPLRWEVTARQAVVNGIDFVYEPIEFQRPAGIDAPKCIP